MKKIIFLFLLVSLGLSLFAQKKNGSVFSEHEVIDKTKAMWTAFVKGDKEAYLDFFADEIWGINNGDPTLMKKEQLLGTMTWWKGVENLKIDDAAPAYPDAIEYKGSGLWVQDWLNITGIHQLTGIPIKLHLHNLYQFNDEGKIDVFYNYFNNNVFEEITQSQTTRKNGNIYIHHPHINTVRKLVNAFLAGNFEKCAEFFTPNARFSNTSMTYGESVGLEERMKELEAFFANYDNIEMVQHGYPDCFYYDKTNHYAVQSWWKCSVTNKEKKKNTYLLMMGHNFDNNGKITNEMLYFSTNHLEN